jgi:transposase
MENPPRATGFIRYQTRSNKETPSLYGTFCPSSHGSKRVKTEADKDRWLGKVIDKERGIFYNRNDGFFRFTVESGYTKLSKPDCEMLSKAEKNLHNNSYKQAKSCSIGFGDVFIINSYLESTGLFNIFKSASKADNDTLLSLILYRLLHHGPNLYAYNWWERSYCQFIYPKAQLESQRISDYLVEIGDENNFRLFIDQYIKYTKTLTDKFNILIDSTGLPNSIKIPLTSVNNHNGVISNEIRLIFVVERNSGYPIYYRSVPGNIVDVSTLNMIIAELREYDIKIDRAILDAGYYSENNIKLLIDNGIPFMSRMICNRGLYNDLINIHVPSIKVKSNFVTYHGRSLFVKKVPVKLYSEQLPAFAYICLDINQQHIDEKNYYSKSLDKISDDQMLLDMNKHGVFILTSTIDIEISELLPCYYTRQSVEQIFDYLKNEADILPIRVHSKLAFNGHVLISFMTTICYIAISHALSKINISPRFAFEYLNSYYARKYTNRIIPDVSTKKINDVAKILKVKIPKTININ